MQEGRPAQLTTFLDALSFGLAGNRNPDARAMLERVFAKLERIAAPRVDGPADLPVCGLLEPALAELERPEHPLADLARSLRALAPQLQWSERPGPAPNANDIFAGGHANAMIIGPSGIEDRRDLWIGISLLAPGVRYPDHDHAPPEVYLVLTPGKFMHGSGDWLSPGVGGFFYNPPGILHAMTADPEHPLLAVWILDVS